MANLALTKSLIIRYGLFLPWLAFARCDTRISIE
jgi:hypothetical protein